MVRRGVRYFLRGLLFLLPILGLVWIIDAVATFGSKLFPDLPSLVGALFIILFVTGVGYGGSRLLAFFLRSRLTKTVERIPLLSLPIKAMGAFYKMGVRAMIAFDQPVLVPGNGPEERRIGFIVRVNARSIGKAEYVPVYLPTPFSFWGDLILLPREALEPLAGVSRDEILDFLISGGISDTKE